MIDQHPAHQSGGETVEMLSVFKLQASLTNELQEEFVDDAGGLQKVLRPLTPEKSSGHYAQVWVNQFEQLLRSRGFPFTPLPQKNRDFSKLSQ
jgi:hypothetical protein